MGRPQPVRDLPEPLALLPSDRAQQGHGLAQERRNRASTGASQGGSNSDSFSRYYWPTSVCIIHFRRMKTRVRTRCSTSGLLWPMICRVTSCSTWSCSCQYGRAPLRPTASTFCARLTRPSLAFSRQSKVTQTSGHWRICSSHRCAAHGPNSRVPRQRSWPGWPTPSAMFSGIYRVTFMRYPYVVCVV